MSPTVSCVVVDLGCLMPGRYARIGEYADRIGVPPAALIALLTGVGAVDPVVAGLPAAAGDRLRAAVDVRRASDRGEVPWAEAMGMVFAAFEGVFGQRWDQRAYMSHLSAGPGVALPLARAAAVMRLDRRMPVVCVATAPSELAAVSAGLIDLSIPVQVSSQLGAARPDPQVWRRAAERAGQGDEWATAHVVVDDPGSATALSHLAEAPAEVWHLDADSEADWLVRVDELAR